MCNALSRVNVPSGQGRWEAAVLRCQVILTPTLQGYISSRVGEAYSPWPAAQRIPPPSPPSVLTTEYPHKLRAECIRFGRSF